METNDEEIRNEIQSQISIKKNQLTEIEKEFDEKEAATEREIDSGFKPQISDIESKLTIEIAKIDDISKNVYEWTNRKYKMIKNIKTLDNEHKRIHNEKASALKLKLKEIGPIEDLNKKSEVEKTIEREFKPRLDEIESKLSKENAKLDEASKNAEEWKDKWNKSNNIIKDLNLDLRKLLKEKTSYLKLKLKEIKKEKAAQIKLINKELKQLNDDLRIVLIY